MQEIGTMMMDSTGAGQWGDDGPEIVMTRYELVDRKLSMIIDGEEFDLPVAPGSLSAAAFDERTVAVCTDSTMVSFADGITLTFGRAG